MLSSLNGNYPVFKANKITPQDQMSTEVPSYFFSLTIYGAA